MKILSLRFKNLNSLKGEWLIDFNSTEFTDNSFFLISGPTGSGKTTILDAICLALYHRTPRLKSLSKESNEIMTRHTGECYSEVTFISGNKKYRSRWEQHKASNKSTGSLQPPRCELCLADSGEILTTKLSEKLKSLEGICGLNFERFTRSVLLAQGNFTAFLKADKKKKAELLEEITGTEVYGQISILAFRRMRSEEEKLKLLKMDLANLSLMSAEEFSSLKKQKSELSDKLKQYNKSHETLTKNLTWLKLLESLQTDISKAQKVLEESEADYKKHEFNFAKLKLALPAQEIQQQLKNLESLNQELTKTDNTFSLTKEEKSKAYNELKIAQQLLTQNEASLKAFLNEKAVQEKIIYEEILPLDNKLEVLNESFKENSKKLIIHEQKKSQILKDFQNLSSQNQQIKKYLDDLNQWLEANKNLEGIIPKLKLLEQQVDEINQLKSLLHSEQEELKSFTKYQKEIDHQINSADSELAQTKQKHAQIDLQIKDVEEKILQLDPDKKINQLLERQKEISFVSKNLTDASQRLRDLHHKTHSHRQQEIKLSKTLQELKGKTSELQKDLSDKKTILEQSRKILEQQRTILDLQEYRDRLEKGSPCMICGSTDHPAIEEYSQIDTSKSKTFVIEAEENFEASQKNFIEHNKDLENLANQMNSILKDLESSKKSFQKEITLWEQNCKNLNVKLDFMDASSVENFQKGSNKKFHELVETSEKLQKLESKKVSLQKSLIEIKEKENLCNSQKAILIEKEKQFRINTNQLSEKISKDENRFKLTTESVDKELKAFKSDDLQNRLKIAKEFSVNYQISQTNQAKFTQDLHANELKLKTAEEALKNLDSEIIELTKVSFSVSKDIKSLSKTRLDKFGKSSTKDILDELSQKHEKLKAAFEKSKANSDKQLLVSTQLEAKLQEIENNQISQKSNLDVTQKAFDKSLNDSPFKDINDLQKNLFSTEQLSELTELKQSLLEKLTASKTRLEDLKKTYLNEQKKSLTDEKANKITNELSALSETIQTSNIQLNEVELKIRQQIELKATQSTKISAIENQQKEFNLWATLSSLIGSADGQAFRNFAQGLTLDHLVELANIHLNRLHDRYYLERKEDDSLSLNIIDSYQLDTVRPVETLSGGESFLVSLSLALALSDLASDRVNIESLFLDEGFGTLDAETLETALNALDHLQASGRMIGVISHVQTLKERIPAKIEVSASKGMGISRLNDCYAI